MRVKLRQKSEEPFSNQFWQLADWSLDLSEKV